MSFYDSPCLWRSVFVRNFHEFPLLHLEFIFEEKIHGISTKPQTLLAKFNLPSILFIFPGKVCLLKDVIRMSFQLRHEKVWKENRKFALNPIFHFQALIGNRIERNIVFKLLCRHDRKVLVIPKILTLFITFSPE